MKAHERILNKNDISVEKATIFTAISLLLMAIIAPIANFYILEGLIISGDATQTVNNIINSEGLFRLGIFGLLIIVILDILVGWGLYVVLKQVNKSVSLLAAWFRLAYATILAFALFNLVNVLNLLGSSDYQIILEQSDLHTQVMFSISAFYTGWDLGLFIFGLHLLLIAYLIYKSDYFPRFLGILVALAGLGYLIDSSGNLLSANYNLTIAMYTFIGEVLLIFWLFLRGIKGLNKKEGEK